MTINRGPQRGSPAGVVALMKCRRAGARHQKSNYQSHG